MAPRPLSQRWSSPSSPTIAHYNGRLQWQWHPAMAPRPQLPPRTIAHYNGTQQWHHVHSTAHWKGTQQWHHPKIGPHWNGTQQWHHVHSPPPPHHSTLQWQWHSAMAPRPPPKVGRRPPPNHTTLQWHPTMAPMAPNHCTLQWQAGCHVQSAKVVRRPPPLLEVRTPIAIAIWGNKLAPLTMNLEVPTLSSRISNRSSWTARGQEFCIGLCPISLVSRYHHYHQHHECYKQY